MHSLRWLFGLLIVALLSFTGCGGKDKADPKAAEKEVALDDALALLPKGAIAAGTIDARAFFGSATFGADLGKLVETYLPLGPEAGFVPSRDVDRVTLGSYSYQGVDVAAIVVGRFDVAKIKQVAASQTPTKAGAPLVVSQYAGRDVYTVNNVGFTLLSETRAIVGTESGIRRVLERIQDKRVQRDLPGWMIATLETPGAVLAVAADLETHPIPPETMRQVPVAFLQNLRVGRVVATFKDGVELAGSLTYPDGTAAEVAAEHVRKTANLARWLSVIGIRVHNIDVKTEKSDVQIKLGLDDQSLRKLLAAAPQWLGR